MPIQKKERSVLRDGYATLLGLGWPTCYIDWKMCERANAGLVAPYLGDESWRRYKDQWAREDFRRQL
jgi:hypothetical protein